MKLEYVPIERAERYEHGVDHGAYGKVLVRVVRFKNLMSAVDEKTRRVRRDTELVWRKGCLVWSGNYQPRTYHPAQLEVVNSVRGLGFPDKVFSGGGLTHKRIIEHWPLIRRFLGVNVSAEDVRMDATLHVTK